MTRAPTMDSCRIELSPAIASIDCLDVWRKRRPSRLSGSTTNGTRKSAPNVSHGSCQAAAVMSTASVRGF